MGCDLLELLVSILGTRASDRRILLYKVLGMSEQSNALELSPEYTEQWHHTYDDMPNTSYSKVLI
jgi:hypothetical protein